MYGLMWKWVNAKEQSKRENKIKTHMDLDVWKLGIKLVKVIYITTKAFPKEERNVLISQLRWSAISIPSNIAEGAARNSNKEFIQFLYFSLGSLSEIETQLIIAKELVYSNDINRLTKKVDTIRPKLLNLIKYLKSKEETH